MAKDGIFRKLLTELRPHAIWELLRWIGPLAAAAIISALASLVQKFRHASFDWLFFGGIFTVSFLICVGFLYVAKRVGAMSERQEADAALRGAEERITNLERQLNDIQAKKESTLPALRPKIVPVRWGRAPDNSCGLFVRNDGEPAFDISIEEPILVGKSKLQFWGRVHPGLTKADGELLLEANIELGTGYGLTANGLRDQMQKADLGAITLRISYSDMDGQKWTTLCELARDFWGTGLRISGVRQQRTA